MIIKISLALLAFFVLYHIISFIRRFMLHMKLQRLAETYQNEFRYYVETTDGWQTFSHDETDGKGCIKLIPQPAVTSMYYYYVKYNGPIRENDAIKLLINGFNQYINNRKIH